MNKHYLTLIFLFISITALTQNAQKILEKSVAQSRAIKNGYYEMSHFNKGILNADTTTRKIKCFFKKVTGNPFSSSLYRYEDFYQGNSLGTVIFTGDDLIRLGSRDSAATIKANSFLEKNYGRENKLDISLYQPFSDSLGDNYLPHAKKTKDSNVYHLLGDEIINGNDCYQVQVTESPEPDTTKEIQTFCTTYTYWINKTDFLPVQYAVNSRYLFKTDTLNEFQKFAITKYNLNNQADKSMFDIASIPSYYKPKNYASTKRLPLLPKNSSAPNFVLRSLNTAEIKLNELRGQLVLIDFFYQGCLPCIKAFPALNSLNVKYKDQD